MAITQIDAKRQMQDATLSKEKLQADFLEGANLDLTGGNNDATLGGLAAGSLANDAVNKAQMEAAITAAVTGGMTYKGVIDASDATGVTLDGALAGDFYVVSVAGVLDGKSFSIGDHLIVNTDITDFDVDGAGKIDKVDNTESDDILRDADIQNNLTTSVAGSVLDASQGKILKDVQDNQQTEIDDTQSGAGLNTDGSYTPDAGSNYITGATSLHNADSLLDDQIKLNEDAITQIDLDLSQRIFGEAPTVTNGSAVVTLANPPAGASLRVYLNGMRQFEGAGNDYTFTGSTVTFSDTLKDPKDVVIVDYEY